MIIEQKDLINYFDDIKVFCRDALMDCKHEQTRRNMDDQRWIHNRESLLNCLYIQKKISPLFLATDNDKIIGLAGIEKYNDDVAIIGKRLFILKQYRNQLIHWYQIIKPQIQWCKNNGYKIVIWTHNEYKKILLKHTAEYEDEAKRDSSINFIILPKTYQICGRQQYITGIYLNDKYKEKNIEQWMKLS